MSPEEKISVRKWRWLVTGFHTAIISLLLFLLKMGGEFITDTVGHWRNQDKRMDKIEQLLTDHVVDDKKEKEALAREMKEIKTAYDLHDGQIKTIADQCNANTGSIGHINTTIMLIQGQMHR